LISSHVKSSAPQVQTATDMAGKAPSSSAIRQLWNRRTTTAVAFAVVLLLCWTLGPASIVSFTAVTFSFLRTGSVSLTPLYSNN
jgi:hypothetical protein